MVARTAVIFVQRLRAVYPIAPENIHFIGFSLGGQMSGFFARHFYDVTSTRIGRITALDVASPGFEDRVPPVYPFKGDALFIEALHTSAGDKKFGGKVGMIAPFGDVDYYPNGGVNQPGCQIWWIPCSHQRAFALYTSVLKTLHQCQMTGK